MNVYVFELFKIKTNKDEIDGELDCEPGDQPGSMAATGARLAVWFAVRSTARPFSNGLATVLRPHRTRRPAARPHRAAHTVIVALRSARSADKPNGKTNGETP